MKPAQNRKNTVCLEIEVTGLDEWKRACELWKQPGCFSERITLIADSHNESEQQQEPAPILAAQPWPCLWINPLLSRYRLYPTI